MESVTSSLEWVTTTPLHKLYTYSAWTFEFESFKFTRQLLNMLAFFCWEVLLSPQNNKLSTEMTNYLLIFKPNALVQYLVS